MALGCCKGMLLNQAHPKAGRQETAGQVTTAKVALASKYVSGVISANRSTLDHSCVFIWSVFSRRTLSVCKYVYKCAYWV